MAANKKDTEIKDLKEKLQTLVQAIHRLQRLLGQTTQKADRAVDISRKNAMEIEKLKRLLQQRI